ncbi:MAG TPA: hypothetical protein VLS96_18045 [Nodosilinea sp.]|nr:hypothetical protein [Nodosilinea sp.]
MQWAQSDAEAVEGLPMAAFPQRWAKGAKGEERFPSASTGLRGQHTG